MSSTPSPFCVIPTGLPPIINPTSIPSPTSYIYTLPAIRSYNHVVVFLLPGIVLPENTAAAVYISLPSSQSANPNPNPQFKFLGGIGPGKESAVFKISGLVKPSTQNGNTQAGGESLEIDMDAPENSLSSSTMPEIILGISVESSESVAAQMAALQESRSSSTIGNQSQALVLSGSNTQAKPNTLLLAQRIIKNAFNFLTSFSGNTSNGIEVVPLKAFEDWWRKFEGRVKNDPAFLERQED